MYNDHFLHHILRTKHVSEDYNIVILNESLSTSQLLRFKSLQCVFRDNNFFLRFTTRRLLQQILKQIVLS